MIDQRTRLRRARLAVVCPLTALLLVIGLPALPALPAAGDGPGLEPAPVGTLSAPVADGLELLHDGDLEAAEAAFRTAVATDPDDPASRYGLALVSWWRTLISDGAPSALRECEVRVEDTLRVARAARSSRPALASFYEGRAYGTRALLRSVEREWTDAARDAKRMRSALEEALRADPGLTDAWAGLGMYDAAMSQAPRTVRFLGFFVGLPGGDMDRGLQRLRRAAQAGGPYAPEAALFLSAVQYGLLNRPGEALETLERLREAHPENGFLPVLEAYLWMDTWGRPAAAHRAVDETLRLAGPDQPFLKWPALLLRARAAFQAGLVPEALADLEALDRELPAPLVDLRPKALRLRTKIEVERGDRDAARAFRDRILAEPAWAEHHDAARAEVSRPHDERAAEVFRANLAGRRAAAHGHLGAARQAFQSTLERFPGDAQTRYRLAELLLLEGRWEEAARSFAAVARQARSTPTWVAPWAWVKAGWAHDALGQRDRAKEAYERAHEYEGRYDELAVRAAERFEEDPYRPPPAAAATMAGTASD